MIERKRFPLRRAALGLAGLSALGMAATAVGTVYVNAARLDIVDKKRAVAKTVATVDRNAPLRVLAKEGRWYKVDVAGQQGYVFEEAVSEKPGSGGGSGVSLSNVKSGAIPQLESAAAVKGMDQNARQYAAGAHQDPRGLEELYRRRDAIQPDEFERFLADGGLGNRAAAQPASIDGALASQANASANPTNPK